MGVFRHRGPWRMPPAGPALRRGAGGRGRRNSPGCLPQRRAVCESLKRLRPRSSPARTQHPIPFTRRGPGSPRRETAAPARSAPRTASAGNRRPRSRPGPAATAPAPGTETDRLQTRHTRSDARVAVTLKRLRSPNCNQPLINAPPLSRPPPGRSHSARRPPPSPRAGADTRAGAGTGTAAEEFRGARRFRRLPDRPTPRLGACHGASGGCAARREKDSAAPATGRSRPPKEARPAAL